MAPETSALVETLYSIAATYTQDKTRQSQLVSAWMLGRAKTLPKRSTRNA